MAPSAVQRYLASDADSDIDGVESDLLLSEGDAADSQTWRSPRRMLMILAGMTALAGCAALTATGMAAQSGTMTVRELFESNELHEVSTENFMRLNGVSLKRDFVRSTVEASFKNITARIAKEAPALHQHISSQRLTPSQQRALLARVRSMGDSRMQALGHDVARAIKEAAPSGQDAVKQRLLSEFRPRLSEVRKLRDEMVPGALQGHERNLVGNIPVGDWRAVAARSKAARKLSDGPLDSFEDDDGNVFGADCKGTFMGSGKEMTMEQAVGILGGCLEEARLLLDDLDFVGAAFQNNGKLDKGIPYWSKSAMGGMDFLVQVLDCVMRTDDMQDPETKKVINTCKFNKEKMMMCPMKYASAAADFFSMIDNLMGVANHAYAAGAGASTTAGAAGMSGGGVLGGGLSLTTAAPNAGMGMGAFTTAAPAGAAAGAANYFLTAPPSGR